MKSFIQLLVVSVECFTVQQLMQREYIKVTSFYKDMSQWVSWWQDFSSSHDVIDSDRKFHYQLLPIFKKNHGIRETIFLAGAVENLKLAFSSRNGSFQCVKETKEYVCFASYIYIIKIVSILVYAKISTDYSESSFKISSEWKQWISWIQWKIIY